MMISSFMDGWRKRIVRVRGCSGITSALIGILIVLISAQAGAQGEGEITSDDIALLEFLGDWGTEEGEWIDPLLFDDEAPGIEPAVTERSIAEGLETDDAPTVHEKRGGKMQNPFEGEEIK